MKSLLKMMKYFLFLYIITFRCLFSLDAQTKKYPADIEEKIRQVENNLAGWIQTGENDTWTLTERMKKYNINGLSISLIHNYKIEWARGYGFAHVAEKRPVTEETLFQAASISKSLNSVGVLKLAQEKRLDLNSDINKYLVTWKFPYDEKSKNKVITLANILSHTGGLTISGFPGYAKGEVLPSIPQILDGQKPANTGPVRSSTEPGKRVIYSGGGVTISQMIVMDITNKPYDIYMKENVLDLLGMTSSSFTQPPPASKEKLLATGYKADGREVTGRYHIYPEQAAAGLWTNPNDLCRYIIETQLSYKGESSKVLTPEMTRLRLTPVLEDAALGAFVNSRVTGSFKYFNHNGGNEGFCCTAIGCINDGEGLVIMTNTDSNNNSILEEIANSVATVYKWKDYYLPEIKKVVDVETSILDKYVGKYDLDGKVVTFKISRNGLLVSVFGDLYWKVYFTSDDEFFIKEFRGYLKFLIDKDNKVTGFLFNGIAAKKTE
jgi:CubicO group peptidase (beta-lactamase class C family)